MSDVNKNKSAEAKKSGKRVVGTLSLRMSAAMRLALPISARPDCSILIST
jgi:hypothetical protein